MHNFRPRPPSRVVSYQKEREIWAKKSGGVGLVVIMKERQTDLTWILSCIEASCAPAAGSPVMAKRWNVYT